MQPKQINEVVWLPNAVLKEINEAYEVSGLSLQVVLAQALEAWAAKRLVNKQGMRWDNAPVKFD